MNKLDLIKVRDSIAGDRNFILATWLRGLRYGNSWFNAIEPQVYFAVYQKVIETIMASPNINIKVACLKEDDDVVLGYIIYSGNRADWVFVKKAWRNIGIAKMLWPEQITVVSHLTDVAKSILKDKKGIFFNPFSISP